MQIDISTPKHPNVQAIVDADDYERLTALGKWTAAKTAAGTICPHRKSAKKGHLLFIAREVMGVTNSYVHVDHINGDTLDNRKANLRLSTRSENMRNRKVNKNSSSGLKGVQKQIRGKWPATIAANGRSLYLGAFDTKEDAAKAYDAAAIELHGEFARTNAMMGLI
jgi:hypothetical protein